MSQRVTMLLAVLATLAAILGLLLYGPVRHDDLSTAARGPPVRRVPAEITYRFGEDQRPSYLERHLERYGLAEIHYRSLLGRYYENELSSLGEAPLSPGNGHGFALRLLDTGGPRTPAWVVRAESLPDGRLSFRAAASSSPGYAYRTLDVGFERRGVLTLDESIRVRDLALRAKREFLRSPIVTGLGADGYFLFVEFDIGGRSTFLALFFPDQRDFAALFALKRRLLMDSGIWRPLRAQPAHVVRGPWDSPGSGAYCAEPLVVVGGFSDAERIEAARRWMRRKYPTVGPMPESRGFCWATLGMLPRYGIGRHIRIAGHVPDGRPIERYFRLLPNGPRTEHLLRRWGPHWEQWAASVWPPGGE